jgi:hypothetical protein
MIFGDSGVSIFKEIVSPTLLFYSSSLCVSLFPTSLDENELSKGVKPLRNLSYSIEIISLGLNCSFCIKRKFLHHLGKPAMILCYHGYEDDLEIGTYGQVFEVKFVR